MTDKEIAEKAQLKHISLVAKELGLTENNIEYYGNYKAKIKDVSINPKGKLILVTAINPTKAGEGKTTVSIGLADGLRLIGKKTCLALREPSLGPVFGMKGGATGGGYSQVVPMADINLHFTGDMHAITSANNLICAVVDNHIYQGNELGIEKVVFNRCLDVNDRALREISCFGREERRDRFNITAASELMAIMCLSENIADLKRRIANIIVGFNKEGKAIYCKDLGIQDAATILLKDAIKPNLVQSLAGTPALIHCGPFANIAHGCNSVIATKTALSLSDYVVTEAGFGADLGAEKFLDVKCRVSGLKPDAVVLVATIRALKLHGGMSEKELKKQDYNALEKGLSNLERHMFNIKNVYGLNVVVAINVFADDTEDELCMVDKFVKSKGFDCVRANVWGKGGEGAKELAHIVVENCDKYSDFSFAYKDDDSILTKCEKIVRNVYGGKGVILEDKARNDLKMLEVLKVENLPVVIAKTQYSFSDKAELIGAPNDFDVVIKEFQIRAGAGFIVAVAGNMLLMPALNKKPAALKMKIDDEGNFNL